MSAQNINNLTAIIVDDELHGRENLKHIIETYCPEIEILGLANSVIRAKELVSQVNPEVVFLDINMPVLDGFDFLEEYDERNFMVVFVSAHKEFGINAVKAGAVDYILKPISIKELKQTVKKLLSLKQKAIRVEPAQETSKLVIPSSHGFNILIIDDIIRLEADGCYTTITTNDGKNIIVSRTLKDFEDTLSKDKFFRTHKSHLINLKYIKDYSNLSGNNVTMTNGSKVEISRRKAPDFIKKVKSFLKSV
ncbi:MAG TPA: response regulator transcription factor [Candidatus Pacearchaeota archaeon]|nr:response regulator transcription factor [Candidatus Pacearchaeota archaeon]